MEARYKAGGKGGGKEHARGKARRFVEPVRTTKECQKKKTSKSSWGRKKISKEIRRKKRESLAMTQDERGGETEVQ